MDNEKLSWALPEYEHRERSTDWFWALGIVVVAGAVAAVIYNNYFFAGILIIGGALMGYFASSKPKVFTYELGEKGLKIENRLFLYKTIKHFWVREGEKPMLLVYSDRLFMPVITIPIENEYADKMRSILLMKGVLQQEIEEHPADKIMEVIGF